MQQWMTHLPYGLILDTWNVHDLKSRMVVGVVGSGDVVVAIVAGN